jgi:hypothetical protein
MKKYEDFTGVVRGLGIHDFWSSGGRGMSI